MRSPAGEEHWTRGTFVEVTPHSRLVIDMHATDSAGGRCSAPIPRSTSPTRSAARAWTWCRPTRFIDPSMAAPMVAGAPEGWRTTLDKLEEEVVRMQGGTETGVRSVVHATFHLERTYDAPVARVWQALTDEAAKQKWFGGTPGQLGTARAAHGRPRRRQRAAEGPLGGRRGVHLRRHLSRRRSRTSGWSTAT